MALLKTKVNIIFMKTPRRNEREAREARARSASSTKNEIQPRLPRTAEAA